MIAHAADVAELVKVTQPFTADELPQLEEMLLGEHLNELRRAVDEQLSSAVESEGQTQRLGVCCYYLTRHRQSHQLLEELTGDPVACFVDALALSALEEHGLAEEKFAAAAKAGFDRVDAELRRAGAIRAQNRLDEAEQLLRSIAAEAASRAEYSFQMGCILADRGDTFGAIEYFERAADMDPHHSRALFWLASENSLRGDDDRAILLYEQSLSKPPYYVGALINLGLLYEDKEKYGPAAFCFRRVLEFDPTHKRARLYMKDIEATEDMFYDEAQEKEKLELESLLARSVTEFELSVRSRNCLQAMDIYTLGDLTRVSEQTLLAGKNFGETSLAEIKEILGRYNLEIGQYMSEVINQDLETTIESLPPQQQALLAQGVSELNLSVRARKCMNRLGIDTLGQLVQRTPDELLASRNFGVTSLNEIRGKLAEINLKLRND